MVLFKSSLSPAHLRGLKDHKYKAEGTSITEVFFQPFWKWSVAQVPLWVAPNLLTFTGLVINLTTCIAVIATDLNAEGRSPPILYLLAGLGMFIYQTLDGIDGKQARRTGTNNPLGELFDHGCDAVSTFIVALAGTCAVGLSSYPYLLLGFVLCIEFVNYIYHWQTYVSGCLYFKKLDCTEAQLCHIAIMIVAYFAGPGIWSYPFPGLGVPIVILVAVGLIGSSIMNIISAFVIIFSQGVGKNGATIADTSVLSPILPIGILLYCSVFYCFYSSILLHHSMLLMLAMVGPFIKFILHIMIAGMCKMPLPLFDPVLIGPVIAIVNVMTGAVISELYLLIIITIFNLYDLVSFCLTVVRQICGYLEVNCFTIPFPPPSMTTTTTPTVN